MPVAAIAELLSNQKLDLEKNTIIHFFIDNKSKYFNKIYILYIISAILWVYQNTSLSQTGQNVHLRCNCFAFKIIASPVRAVCASVKKQERNGTCACIKFIQINHNAEVSILALIIIIWLTINSVYVCIS